MKDGEAEVVAQGGDGGEVEKRANLSKNDYFGEIALLRGVPRTATVRAKGTLERRPAASPAEGGWITATGNSFAAPHITGIAARILGKHPSLTLFQLKTILRALSANMG